MINLNPFENKFFRRPELENKTSVELIQIILDAQIFLKEFQRDFKNIEILKLRSAELMKMNGELATQIRATREALLTKYSGCV